MNARTHHRKTMTRLVAGLAAASMGLLSLTGAGAASEIGHTLGIAHEHQPPAASTAGVSVHYTLFQPDGTPVRAEAEVSELQLSKSNEPSLQ